MSTSISASNSERTLQASEPAQRNLALVPLALCIFICQLDTNIVNVALPTLMQSFGVGFEAIEWVVLTYLLAVTALVVGVGRLGDLVGKRRLFLSGLILFMAASAGCGLATRFEVLLLGRALQGLGAATLVSLSFALASEVVPASKNGMAMGVLGTLSSLGTTMGPPIGGMVIATLGWRAMFLVNVPLGLLALALARQHLPARAVGPAAGRPPFDLLGAFLLMATLVAYSVAMSSSQSLGFANRKVLTLLGLAFTALVLFLLRQARGRNPLLRLEVVREPLLSTGLGAMMLVMAVMMSTMVLGPFYLSRTLGLSPRGVGLSMAVGPLLAALLAAPAGRLSDRIGARLVSVMGLACFTLGAFVLSRITPAWGLVGYLGALGILSVGYALFQTPNSAAVIGAASSEHRGVVSSLLILGRNLGLISGASLMTSVFASVVGSGHGSSQVASAAPDAIASGLRAAFTLSTLLGAAALALACVALRAQRSLGRASSTH